MHDKSYSSSSTGCTNPGPNTVPTPTRVTDLYRVPKAIASSFFSTPPSSRNLKPYEPDTHSLHNAQRRGPRAVGGFVGSCEGVDSWSSPAPIPELDASSQRCWCLHAMKGEIGMHVGIRGKLTLDLLSKCSTGWNYSYVDRVWEDRAPKGYHGQLRRVGS